MTGDVATYMLASERSRSFRCHSGYELEDALADWPAKRWRILPVRIDALK
jgi:hypothetical protein